MGIVDAVESICNVMFVDSIDEYIFTTPMISDNDMKKVIVFSFDENKKEY